MKVSHCILTITLILTGATAIAPEQEIVAFEIAETEGDRFLSHHPRFLLSRAFYLALTLEAESDSDKKEHLKLLGEIALKTIDAGQWKTSLFDNILAAIEAIEFEKSYYEESKVSEFVRIINRLEEVGEIERALAIANRTTPLTKTEILWDIAKFWFEQGNRDRGLEFLRRVTESSKAIHPDYSLGKTRLLQDIAQFWLERGDSDRRLEFLRKAAESARKIEHSGFSNSTCWDSRADILTEIALDYAEIGKIEAALALVPAIQSCGWVYKNTSNGAKPNALFKILDLSADRNHLQRAIAIAENMAYMPDKTHALGSLASRSVEKEDLETILEIAQTLENYEVYDTLIKTRDSVELSVVERRIELERIEAAISLAKQIDDPFFKTSAFLELARYFENKQQREQAEIWFDLTLDMAHSLDVNYNRKEIVKTIALTWSKWEKIDRVIELLQRESDESFKYIVNELVKDGYLDLALQVIQTIQEPRRKLLALITVALTQEKETDEMTHLLKQAIQEFVDRCNDLDELHGISWLSIILSKRISVHSNWNIQSCEAVKSMILYLDTQNTRDNRDTQLDTQWSNLERVFESSIANGEFDRAFAILESVGSEIESQTLEKRELWRAKSQLLDRSAFFFEKLVNESDRYISEAKKRSFFEGALKLHEIFETNRDEYDDSFRMIAIELIPLAFELKQFDRLLLLLRAEKQMVYSSDNIANFIKSKDNLADIKFILDSVQISFDTNTMASILGLVIPHLDTVEALELVLEFFPNSETARQAQPSVSYTFSIIAVRLGEFGEIERAIKYANAIANIESRAKTLAEIAAAIK